MPVLPPKPPFGGIRWAASPARNTRPSWYRARDVGASPASGRRRRSCTVEVGHAGADADELDQPLPRCVSAAAFGDVGIGLRIADRVDDEEPRLAVLGEPEEAAEHGLLM